MPATTTVFDLFKKCVNAIRDGKLIHRESQRDKEFHFQNWFQDRIAEAEFEYECGGRNSYPDFRIVKLTEGYEIKALAYPGREVNYDCNSQVPTGQHNGRTIFYVFGRYPAQPDGDRYPVLDLVICHGDFLNADHEYVHENKNVKGFGSYGDIMIRDRKMYVAPTPFGLATGAAHHHTLILPKSFPVMSEWRKVGTLIRREADTLIVGYSFDLTTNQLIARTIPNPGAGREHAFFAWRMTESRKAVGPDDPVKMRPEKAPRKSGGRQ
ncbi:MAG: hypothetical protein IID44_26450 [Planctomycetes bacterium]|nr:hypothetical protein [Planctomycetota bacterium]